LVGQDAEPGLLDETDKIEEIIQAEISLIRNFAFF